MAAHRPCRFLIVSSLAVPTTCVVLKTVTSVPRDRQGPMKFWVATPQPTSPSNTPSRSPITSVVPPSTILERSTQDSWEFGDGFYHDAGLGLRLNLPFGPLALDYAFPLGTPDGLEEDADQGGQFQFYLDYKF